MTLPPSRPIVLYIAGPMTGLPENNYPAFNRAAVQLAAAGYRVMNPVRSDHRPDAPRPFVQRDPRWSDFMRNGINQLVRADGIALLDGWIDSRGARLEVGIANNLDLPTEALNTWLNADTTERAA